MDFQGMGTLVTAIFAGIGTLLVALNGRRTRADDLDEKDKVELKNWREWYPLTLRWYARERAKMAAAGAPDLEPLPPFPPAEAKQKPVKSDET